MLLAVDVGNTNLVFAIAEGGKLIHRWRIATDPRRTGDEYAVWLSHLMQLEGLKRSAIDQVIVSTVVPRALHNLTVLSEKYFNLTPLIAGKPPVEWGFAIDVDEPGQLGADRAVNAIAAHQKWDGDLIVVDFGTATTFDVIDFNGAYKGGSIAPGINLSLDALVGKTAQLPRIAIESPGSDNVIGRNTQDQMLIGIFWGYIAMIEGMVARLQKQIGRPAKVIATGGLAVLFDEHTEIFDHVDTELTLEGMVILAERAKGAA